MVIEKILNNNAIVSLNEDKSEIIVMGRGVAFGKRPGDLVDKDRVEKVFTLENDDLTNKLKELIEEIPMEYMKLSEDIIKYAKLQLGKKLNDNIYISLTDHIHYAVERYKKGLTIKNGLLWETKNLYKEEFQIGMEALKMIDQALGVKLPEDEAAFIALHIVNAELNEDMGNIMAMTEIVQEILKIVQYHFLYKKYQYMITQDEMMYLTIHIERVVRIH